MRLSLTQAWIDDLKIHDVDDPDIVYSIRSANRKLTPRRVEFDRAQRDGTIDRSKFYGSQIIDLAGYVSAPSDVATDDAYDALCAKLALSERSSSSSSPTPEHVFRFRRLGRLEDEEIAFKVGGGPEAPQEGWGRMVRYAVTLVGPDPRVYSAALKSASYDPTSAQASGGVAMPLVMPLVFTSTTPGELVAYNAGTRKTPPLLTVIGPVSNFAIDNATTQESLVFGASLGSSDQLDIDVDARSVKLNGAERKDLLDGSQSTWFELEPGENDLQLRGSGMAIGQTLLTVQFRDARI